MGVFKSMRDLQKQARDIQNSAPPLGDRLAAMQARMADVSQAMEMQTRAANAAAAGAGGLAARCPVVITGMRQVGTVNFDLLVEFELTVTPEGTAPYPATTQQLVNQFQASQLQPGRSLLAAVDPSSPGAIWLDFGSLR